MDKYELLEKYINYLKCNDMKYPVSGLDASSLYPSLIITYNLSPEYLVLDKDYMLELKKKNYPIHEINFDYNYEDYQGNSKTKTIIGWTVRHNCEKDNYGLYPRILMNLFKQRKEMKKELFIYKEKKEHIEKYETDYENKEEYLDCIFKLKYFDSKQKALKVFMNTFYGELGNKNSPIFILELAGGITSSGQNNLLKVKKFVEDLDHKVYYGDTDSLYISCPERHYLESNKLYYTKQIDKKKYCEELVNITFEKIDVIKQLVNKFLLDDNGTPHLQFAYEEVLYPVSFLSRKKYYGVPHEGIVNFNPSELFIRGLEVKKRGVSEFLKIICMEIMLDSMSINNTKELKQLVEEKIEYIFTTTWNIDNFVQNGVFKPDKNNITMQNFYKRMISEGKTPPKPYERFNYIITKITDPNRLFDFKGRKIDIKKFDKMEYIDYAKEHNIEFDLNYYFEKQLITQFARLISYHEDFIAYENIPTCKTDYDIFDAECVTEIDSYKFEFVDDNDATLKNCKKYISKFAKQFYENPINYGKLYKELYRKVNLSYKQVKQNKTKYDLILSSSIISNDDDIQKNENDLNIIELINMNIDNQITTICNVKDEGCNIANRIIKSQSEDMFIKMYNNRHDSYYNKIKRQHENNFSIKMKSLIDIVTKNNLENSIFNVGSISIYSTINNLKSKYINNKIANDTLSINEIISDDIIIDEMKTIEKSSISDDEKKIFDSIYDLYVSLLSIKKSICILDEIHNSHYSKYLNSNGHMTKPVGFKL